MSVHGANRLGANSLLDLVVLGRACGRFLEKHISAFTKAQPSQANIEQAFSRCYELQRASQGVDAVTLRKDMKKIMQEDFGVFREHESMQEGLKKLQVLREMAKQITINDHSSVFNTEMFNALELQNLVEVAFATAISALDRKESRGAHSRVDFPDRDDKNWLKHSIANADGSTQSRPVNKKPKFTKPIKTALREH